MLQDIIAIWKPIIIKDWWIILWVVFGFYITGVFCSEKPKFRKEKNNGY